MPQNRQPTEIPDPLFPLGTTVRWNALKRNRESSSTDFGTVMGMRYVWSHDLQDWQYQYYIVLNTNSPSYQWTQFDWGWQEDLEAISLKEEN